MSGTPIRAAMPSDCEPLSRLREALWPDSSSQQHAEKITSILGNTYNGKMPLVIFVAEDINRGLVGFIEVGLRSHADGCDPSRPVGFVEGWFVADGERGKGLGRQLLAAAEEWARGNGCTEIASDTWVDHGLSQRVHQALGFEVVDRCVHYRKVL